MRDHRHLLLLLTGYLVLVAAGEEPPRPLSEHPLPTQVGLWSMSSLEQVAPGRTALPADTAEPHAQAKPSHPLHHHPQGPTP